MPRQEAHSSSLLWSRILGCASLYDLFPLELISINTCRSAILLPANLEARFLHQAAVRSLFTIEYKQISPRAKW